MFADAPHLLKLLRNHFLDEGFNIDDRLIDKKCIEKMLAINVKDLKVAFAISQYHLDVKGFERQKVLPAAQLLSNKTACAIEWCGQKHYLENTNWKETSNCIKLCNNWFDVFNSSNMYGKHEGKNAYGIDLQKQNTILYEMTDLMHKIKIGEHKKLLLFQKGIIVSNNSLEQLFIYLKEKYSDENFVMKYVITRRLNQDLLENFFSFIRATGCAYDHPTALDFKYRLKRYILGKHLSNLFCRTSNVTTSESNVSYLMSLLSIEESSVLRTESSSVLNGDTKQDTFDEQVLSNMLAPYIVQKEPSHFAEEMFANYVDDENDDLPLCHLSSFNMSVEQEQLLQSLDP